MDSAIQINATPIERYQRSKFLSDDETIDGVEKLHTIVQSLVDGYMLIHSRSYKVIKRYRSLLYLGLRHQTLVALLTHFVLRCSC